MSIGRQLGDLGSDLLGTVGELVDSYGDRAVNAANADATRIQAAQSNILINEARAQADIEAKRNLNKMLQIVAYMIIGFVGIMVLAQVYKMVKK